MLRPRSRSPSGHALRGNPWPGARGRPVPPRRVSRRLRRARRFVCRVRRSLPADRRGRVRRSRARPSGPAPLSPWARAPSPIGRAGARRARQPRSRRGGLVGHPRVAPGHDGLRVGARRGRSRDSSRRADRDGPRHQLSAQGRQREPLSGLPPRPRRFERGLRAADRAPPLQRGRQLRARSVRGL